MPKCSASSVFVSIITQNVRSVNNFAEVFVTFFAVALAFVRLLTPWEKNGIIDKEKDNREWLGGYWYEPSDKAGIGAM